MRLSVSLLVLVSFGAAAIPQPLRADQATPSAAWESLVSKIQPGLTRAGVEAWLNEMDGGPQGIDSTRYFIQPDIIVEVPYDQTGGTWTPENRVSAPVHIVRRSRSTF
jgi:hypothetical protein